MGDFDVEYISEVEANPKVVEIQAIEKLEKINRFGMKLMVKIKLFILF